MNIIELAKIAKKDNTVKVRRKLWAILTEKERDKLYCDPCSFYDYSDGYMYLVDGRFKTNEHNHLSVNHIRTEYVGERFCPDSERDVFFTLDDILADDWEVVEEKARICYFEEWQENKPNFIQFIDEKTGYKCFIWRNPDLKTLCGYVELPKEHKFYKKDIKDFSDIDVHGEVTYAGERDFMIPFCDSTIVKHSEYVVGFDCNHINDYRKTERGAFMYRNIDFVTNECIKLAKQLKDLEN